MNRQLIEEDIVVSFKEVSKKFGNFTAVNKINLSIYQGEILGFLGENGAGKSTTMKLLANLLKPSEGEIYIRGNNHLEKMNTDNKDRLLKHLGFLIENPAFYNMTPRQILTYFAELKGYPASKIRARVETVINQVGMIDWIDKNLKGFSKGMRQKIGIASAIVHDPKIVIFDEPQTGLDPKARIEIRDLILKLRDEGKTIFLSSHLLYEISELADRVAIISHGKIVVCDTLDRLEARAKRSVINIELYELKSEEVDERIEKIKNSLRSYHIANPGTLSFEEIKFDYDNWWFEIPFNGSEEVQMNILEKLITEKIKIIEFSVPKAELLEQIYLKFINDDKATIIDAISAEKLREEVLS